VSPREHARQRVHDPARAALSDIGNPLLASWGRLGREQLGLLLSEEEADLQWVGAARNDETLLQVLQNDILTLRDRDRLFTPPADDHSVIFAETHSRIREIEVLHDALLHLFQRMSGLEPRDVVVMAPAIEEYAGAIEAVFGEISDERRIPWTIADRAALAGDTAARAFLHLLTLPESRFGANEMLGLLSVPAIARRFGIDAEELEDLRDRVLASGVRRGLDESGSAGPGPALERNTWRFGLRRLLLGIAVEDTGPFSGILPIASGGGEDAERIGELADFIDALERHAEALSTPSNPGEWRNALLALLADFFPEASTEFPGVALIQRAIEESCELLEEVRLTATLPREMLVELLTARLAREDGGHGFLGSGVNFCQLTPLRSIPFRVVCLLGMNATGFPRQHEAPAFDLMAGDRRPGDPSRRDDDRYLFLESLVAARDCLYLSRVAKDQRSDELQEPALPLAELGDYIDRRCGKDTVKRLTRQHPLMPFDPRAFDATNPQPSFRREWLPARDALGKRQGAVFGREALPPRAGSTPRLDELLAFWRNPARALLAERWGIRLDEGKASPEDREPLTLDALEKHRLREELLAGLVGEGESLAAARLLASGTLPHGASAQALLQQECDRLMPLALRLRDALRPGEWHSIALPADLPVCGVLDGLQAGRLLEWTISEQAGGRLLLRFWIRHLVGSAADALAGPSTLYTAKKAHTLAPLAPGDATALLHDLVRLREEGLCRALPFFPGAAWAFSKAGKIDDARSAFLGNDFTRGDSQDASIARVFGESAEVLDGEFCDLARCVFGPLRTWLSEGEA
jgi:exodeoxyribonuclease V gamma subunit